MEGKTSEGIGLSSVFSVAGDGVAYPLGVYSDLVLAAGFQFEFHFGVWFPADVDVLECPAMSRCELLVLHRGPFRCVSLLHFVAVHLHGFGVFI